MGTITLPDKPILTDPVLQELLAFKMPSDIVLQTSTFEGTIPLEPVNNAMTVLPFVYVAYANTIQDIIDGKIIETLGYNIPSNILVSKWRFAKDEILRKYHQKRREFLRQNGKRNLTAISGDIREGLMNISIDERRELSSANLKLYQENTDFTYEQIETALKGGFESDAIRFDSHHKLQTANFEVASGAVKATFDVLSSDIEKYNQGLNVIEAEIEKSKADLAYQSQLLDKYAIEIKKAGLQIEDENLLLEVYRAGVEYLIEKSRMDLIFYQSYLINAELEKNKIEKYGLEVDQFAALINAITAEYEVYYAGAKKVRADFMAYKERLGVTRSLLRVQEAELKGEEAIANAELEEMEAQMQAQRDQLRAAEERLEAAFRSGQASIANLEAIIATTLAASHRSLISIITNAIEKSRSAMRSGKEDANIENNTGSEKASDKTTNEHAKTISLRSEYDRATRKARAEAAAMAEVVSSFIHVAATET